MAKKGKGTRRKHTGINPVGKKPSMKDIDKPSRRPRGTIATSNIDF